jgi:hypothetical protein
MEDNHTTKKPAFGAGETYEYDESWKTFLTVVLSVITVFTFVETAFSVYVYVISHDLRRFADRLLLNLMLVGFLTASVILPFHVYLTVNGPKTSWSGTQCAVFHTFQAWFRVTDVGATLAFAIDHHLLLQKGKKWKVRQTKRMLMMMTGLPWVLSLLVYGLPVMVYFFVKHMDQNAGGRFCMLPFALQANIVMPWLLTPLIFVFAIPALCLLIYYNIYTAFYDRIEASVHVEEETLSTKSGNLSVSNTGGGDLKRRSLTRSELQLEFRRLSATPSRLTTEDRHHRQSPVMELRSLSRRVDLKRLSDANRKLDLITGLQLALASRQDDLNLFKTMGYSNIDRGSFHSTPKSDDNTSTNAMPWLFGLATASNHSVIYAGDELCGANGKALPTDRRLPNPRSMKDPSPNSAGVDKRVLESIGNVSSPLSFIKDEDEEEPCTAKQYLKISRHQIYTTDFTTDSNLMPNTAQQKFVSGKHCTEDPQQANNNSCTCDVEDQSSAGKCGEQQEGDPPRYSTQPISVAVVLLNDSQQLTGNTQSLGPSAQANNNSVFVQTGGGGQVMFSRGSVRRGCHSDRTGQRGLHGELPVVDSTSSLGLEQGLTRSLSLGHVASSAYRDRNMSRYHDVVSTSSLSHIPHRTVSLCDVESHLSPFIDVMSDDDSHIDVMSDDDSHRPNLLGARKAQLSNKRRRGWWAVFGRLEESLYHANTSSDETLSTPSLTDPSPGVRHSCQYTVDTLVDIDSRPGNTNSNAVEFSGNAEEENVASPLPRTPQNVPSPLPQTLQNVPSPLPRTPQNVPSPLPQTLQNVPSPLPQTLQNVLSTITENEDIANTNNSERQPSRRKSSSAVDPVPGPSCKKQYPGRSMSIDSSRTNEDFDRYHDHNYMRRATQGRGRSRSLAKQSLRTRLASEDSSCSVGESTISAILTYTENLHAAYVVFALGALLVVCLLPITIIGLIRATSNLHEDSTTEYRDKVPVSLEDFLNWVFLTRSLANPIVLFIYDGRFRVCGVGAFIHLFLHLGLIRHV